MYLPGLPRHGSSLVTTALLLVAAMGLAGCGSGAGGASKAKSDASDDIRLNLDASLHGDAAGGYQDGVSAGDDTADTGLELGPYDAVANCPGGPLCPCSANVDCQAGLCAEDPSAQGGKSCAQACKPGCPGGYVCANLTSGSSDIQQFCVFQAARLCDPCTSSKDCEVAGLLDSKCVDQGPAGRFCGISCGQDSDCPTSYGCQQVSAVEGGKFKQCVRTATKGSGAPFGECVCSASAIQKQLTTSCFVSGADAAAGPQCPGTRACGPGGLSACTAPAQVTETCDGADNDCDGQTDEGGCNDGNPCTKDACGGKNGCSFAPSPAAPCDDGNPCTVGDSCGTGGCDGQVIDVTLPLAQGGCADGNPCTTDSCQPATGCSHKAENGLPCDDGNPCTKQDTCSSGACKPGTFDCMCVKDSDCQSFEDGDLCNGTLYCGTQGGISLCLPKPGSSVGCDKSKDGPCTATACAPATGQCVTANAPDGQSCTDGSACTAGDSCAAGKCSPGKPVACDDGNPCTLDDCDGKSGCTFAPKAGAQPCYTGAPGTQGVGECKAGSQACDSSGQLGTCTGQVVPAKSESCDGIDNTCDGKIDEGCAAAKASIRQTGLRQEPGPQGKAGVRLRQSAGPGAQSKGGNWWLDWSLIGWWQAIASGS